MEQGSGVRIIDEGVGGELRVRAPYELKDELKAFNGAHWNPVHRVWMLERWHLQELLALLRYRRIPFDVLRLDGEPAAQPRRTGSPSWPEALFAALPAHLREPAYKALVKVLHPDVGGDHLAAQALNVAWDKWRSAEKRAS